MLWGTYRALKHFSSSPPHLDAPFLLYPISVLKPLKGVDPGLEANLETFFRLKYPDFELLFSVADAQDAACAVVNRLIKKYPRVRARLIIGQVEVGTNPKINNLIKSYQLAQNDWLLISDSNIRVSSDYLKRMMAHVDSTTGIVTAAVVGRSAKGMGGALEAMHLNTFYSRGMVLAFAAGRPCVLGKSMLFRRSTSERFGGIATLARYLAEDYMAGEAIRALSLKIVLMTDPVEQPIGFHPISSYWSRHVRWGRIRKAQVPAVFILEGLASSGVAGFLGSVAFNTLTGLSPLLFFLSHMAAWYLCDRAILHK